uniref:Galectin n=1 Tax=Myotis lucifugus TaxID=59463 RepID=G1PIM1_MYOLU
CLPWQVLYKKNVFFSVGSSVKINGTPIMPFCMSPELQVDFHTGTNEDSDIAFSLRVYFGKELVMNSRKNGSWEEEVRSTDKPFRDGQPFELDISVLSDQYQRYYMLVQVYFNPMYYSSSLGTFKKEFYSLPLP